MAMDCQVVAAVFTQRLYLYLENRDRQGETLTGWSTGATFRHYLGETDVYIGCLPSDWAAGCRPGDPFMGGQISLFSARGTFLDIDPIVHGPGGGVRPD